jgi:hypothetical protein
MGFELLCMTLIALLVATAITFNGYRWFLILLPIIGFVWGFGIGAQTVQALFGDAFLATTTSWVVGFIVALVFAVLSYLFYFIGVGIVAFGFGYAVGVGFMGLLGLDAGLITWLVGVVLGVVVAGATLLFNLQKYVIIAITAFGGAAAIVASLLFAFGKIDVPTLGSGSVKMAMQDSPFWMIMFLVIGVLGFAAQFMANRNYTLTVPEDRYEMYT